jgi:hypothetical protein
MLALEIRSLLSTCILRENSSFSRKGPVAASPCKGMGQWHLTNPAQGEFSRRKNVQTCFRIVLWPVLARGRPWPARFVHLSVARWRCNGGTGVGPTGEHCPGVIYQGNGSHEIPRLRPTALGTWPWHLRTQLPHFLWPLGAVALDRAPALLGQIDKVNDASAQLCRQRLVVPSPKLLEHSLAVTLVAAHCQKLCIAATPLN